MKKPRRPGFSPGWIVRMAWRDTRTSRRRLVLYAASITLGIAALVSIASYGESLRRAVRSQSTALLGADLVVSADDPLPPEVETLLESFGGRRAREVAFRSMALFPRAGLSRLVSVRAVEDGFPFYGRLDTSPAAAAGQFRAGGQALVEESVLLQLGVAPGEEVKIGAATFRVAGALRSVPGESPGFSLIQPRVYLAYADLPATGVVQRGSQLTYRHYLALPDPGRADALRQEHRPRLREQGIWMETVGSREARTGRIIGNVERFLGLVGFVALLLGAVGVASGIHVFIRQKLGSIATLRCVGATVRQTFLIYLVQAAGLGCIGAVLGAALGAGVQLLIPRAMQGLLPVEVEFTVSWTAVTGGMAAGMGVTLALALLPLLVVRRVSPLLALRSTVEPPRGSWHDPAVIAVVILLAGVLTAVALRQSREIAHAVGFVAGTGAVFVVLALLGRGLMALARRLAPRRAPYVWRQGIANLFRPNNRTLLVILALGLGTFLVVTMQLTQGMLLKQIEFSRQANSTNLILFDIQGDQRAGVRSLVEQNGRPVRRDVPIVTMRVAAVKGRPADELRRERRAERWVLSREYRSTYRDELDEGETIIAGRWVRQASLEGGPVPVSLEEEIATRLGVTVGDAITFDVQGLPIECVVGSIRRVDKQRFELWFFVVFPAGVLEQAPQFGALATSVQNASQSAALQRALLERYPNISAIDLMLVLETFDKVLGMARFAFNSVAWFIVGTGFIVLAGVMVSGRFQRLQESVLLRTLGAARAQIARIQLVEYTMLGTLAALAGVLLAWAASWALGRWIFELETFPAFLPMLVAWVAVSGLTLLTGWLTGRRLLKQPPLEILRQET